MVPSIASVIPAAYQLPLRAVAGCDNIIKSDDKRDRSDKIDEREYTEFLIR